MITTDAQAAAREALRAAIAQRTAADVAYDKAQVEAVKAEFPNADVRYGSQQAYVSIPGDRGVVFRLEVSVAGESYARYRVAIPASQPWNNPLWRESTQGFRAALDNFKVNTYPDVTARAMEILAYLDRPSPAAPEEP
jgi:hypothetical protein